jgi:hypothetical protein
METRRLTITLKNPKKFDEVVNALKSKGFSVERPMKTLGIVSGSVTAKSAAAHEALNQAIASVEGVRGVETEGVIRIAPPGSPVE